MSDRLTLSPETLYVESFPTLAPAIGTGGMKTYEPGCTTPDLCPNQTTAVAVEMKTYEPGCTTPDLCPNNTTVAVAAPVAG